MSSEQEEIRRQLAELTERVARLEARTASHAPGPLPSPEKKSRISARAPAAPSRSLETRIGAQLFNRIGIVAVLIGAAWFLKFAIDNHWIGALPRVIIGLLAGAGLILVSETFRSGGYRAFSLSLKAIGAGIVYLSLWAAFALFHLLPGLSAFAAMILVTAWIAWMCWRQNSEVLAFYAAIGGFVTPLLLANGESHELTLFSYLLLLDIAVLALIALRPWSRLLVAAFAGTLFYSIAWYARYYDSAQFSQTLVFAIAFFLLFALAPQMLRSLPLSRMALHRSPQDNLALIFVPVLNAALAFCEIYTLLNTPDHAAIRPWIAIPFAAFYLLLLRLSRRPAFESAPAALTGMYAVISTLFIALAILLEAHGRWIATGWFIEFAAILWIVRASADAPRSDHAPASADAPRSDAPRSDAPDNRNLYAVDFSLFAIAVAALLLPLRFFNPPIAGGLILNTRFAAYLFAIAISAFAAWLLRRQTVMRPLALTCGLAVTVLAMIAVCLEIRTYWSSIPAAAPNAFIDEQFSYSAWAMLFGAAILAVGFWHRSAFLRWQALVLLALSIAKVFAVDMRQLSQGSRILSFLGLGVLLLVVSFVYQRDWLSLRSRSNPAPEKPASRDLASKNPGV